jgi:hypothetical protein
MIECARFPATIGFPLAAKTRYNIAAPKRAIGRAQFHAYMLQSRSMM